MSFCGFVSVVALTFDETKVTVVHKLKSLFCVFRLYNFKRSVRMGNFIFLYPGIR